MQVAHYYGDICLGAYFPPQILRNKKSVEERQERLEQNSLKIKTTFHSTMQERISLIFAFSRGSDIG